MEFAGAWSCGDFGAAVIDGSPEAAIAASTFKMTVLLGSHRDVAFVFGAAVIAIGLGVDSARAAVEADARDVALIYHDAFFVDVVNDGYVDVGDGAVVIVIPTTPVAAEEADSGIAEAIVNAAVEAHCWSPVAGVPDVEAFVPAPIAWSPKEAGFRGYLPRAGNPEIVVVAIGPIAGNPDVARPRADRLRVDG